MSPETIRIVAIITTASLAVVFDVRSRRIPNVLTFGSALGAFIFAVSVAGVAGLGSAVLAWALGVALFLPFFLLRGMGAGDVKLLAALGAWLGPVETLYLAIFASIAGGVVALVVSLASGYLRRAIANIRLMLTHWRVFGPQAVPGLTLSDTGAPRLAYAIPIAIGALCTLWQE